LEGGGSGPLPFYFSASRGDTLTLSGQYLYLAQLDDNLLCRETFTTCCKPSVVTPYTNFLIGPVFGGLVNQYGSVGQALFYF